jgi:hypothetical protein
MEEDNNHLLVFQMERARQLMAQGRTQEALLLTLDVLLQALDHLRDSLISVRAAMDLDPPSVTPPEDEDQSEPSGNPKKPRSLH